MTKTTKTIYITSDKQEFASEAEAQAHEIQLLDDTDTCGGGAVGDWVISHKDAILAILGARRKPRSDKGKKRQKAEVVA